MIKAALAAGFYLVQTSLWPNLSGIKCHCGELGHLVKGDPERSWCTEKFEKLLSQDELDDWARPAKGVRPRAAQEGAQANTTE